MRIAVAGLWHETNTFALERNDQRTAEVRRGDELVAGPGHRPFDAGFNEAARALGVEVVPTVEVSFLGRGRIISREIFEHYRDVIVEGLRAAAPFDAIYWSLHGAMVAEAPYTDAEGSLLREARRVFGERMPFVATYDFHAIMTQDEVAALNAAFPNNTNPHVDSYERGREAAECLVRILKGEIKPVMRLVHVPIIGPNIGQSTWAHDPAEERRLPLYRLNLLREEMERDTPGIVDLTILGGYGYADTPDTMMSVVATADGDPELALGKARELARAVWAEREAIRTVRPIYPLDEGVRMALAREDAPIVLVDLGDDPGSLTPADSPAVLAALLRLGARDWALAIRAPNVVEAGMAAGVGATITVDVGGAIDQRFYRPLRVTGTVKSIDDGNYVVTGPTHGGRREVRRADFRERSVGPRVVLRLGDKIDVICTVGKTGNDRDFFRSAGIVLEEKRILAVKSNQAHRASLGPIAAGIIDLATPGVSTVDYTSLPFQHLRRPLWPIDTDFEWEG